MIASRTARAVRALAVAVLAAGAAVTTGAAAVPGEPTGVASTSLASGATVTSDAATDADATTATTTQLGVTVEVLGIDPLVLSPGQDLDVTVRLTNTTDAEVAEPRILLQMRRGEFVSRSSLDVWREAGPYEPLGDVLVERDLDEPIAAGATRTVTLSVSGDAITLPTNSWSWGARGLGIQVVDVADRSRVRLGVARTFLVWFPEQTVNPTLVSVLVPVVGPTPGEDATEQVESLIAPQGRLGRLLAATGRSTAVTWALDTWLLDTALGIDADSATDTTDDTAGTASDTSTGSATDASTGTSTATSTATDSPTADAGPDGSATTSPPPDPTRTWAQEMLASAQDREIALLPWADSDVSALVHDDATDLLEEATALAVERATALGLSTASTDLVLPAESLPDLPTAALAAEQGSALVVGTGELDPPAVLTYTPSGRTSVTTADGDATVLVPDERLSSALTTGSVLGTATQESDDGEDSTEDSGTTTAVTPAEAAADLLAELAVITRERPADSRHMLLATSRDWVPDVEVVTAELAALADAPFVELASVADLITEETTTAERGSLPDTTSSDGEVTASTLDRVSDAIGRRVELASMVSDPEALIGDTQAEQLAPASVAWRDDPVGRRDLVRASVARTEAIAAAVTAPGASTVNLISSTGDLPIQLSNDLDQDVTVEVRLQPSDGRLVAQESATTTIPAQGETTVSIPVRGVQTADVTVTVEVYTPTGVLVDDSTTLTVRVRAEWEDVGTAIVGVLLAAGLVAGLVRTIRRGRRPAPHDVPTPAPADAPAPEGRATTDHDDGPGAG